MSKAKSLKTIEDLVQHQLIADQDINVLQHVAEQFNISITPTMMNVIEVSNAHDPISAQFVPSSQELVQTAAELSDPIGDSKHEKIKGLVHRYPDRCLLKVVHVCPVYCRFCFRKEVIGPGNHCLSLTELEQAYDYIKQHPEIWEVILTGGDPLILKPTRLAQIIKSLEEIAHVEVIRIHTRVPVVEPARICSQMINALKISKPVYIALHANHPNEFTQEAIAACADLVNAGIPMLSQSVLLKGVNDDPDTLSKLMRTFVRHRIKPYYLHHLDLAKGTGHFRVSIEEGQKLMKFLQGRFSGLCQPTYVLDIPGGAGKIPLNPSYHHKQSETEKWLMEDYLGNFHCY